MNPTTAICRLGFAFAVLGLPLGLCAQVGARPTAAPAWTLPADLAVVAHGPRTYRFTIDYYTASPSGDIVRHQRVTGDYTRDLPHGEVEWHDVGVATSTAPAAALPAPDRCAFMEGFRYRNDPAATMAPAFFKSFPAAAFMERNLVWDAGMLESFGQNHFDQLKLNVPLHVGGRDQDVPLGLAGSFRNHDIVLEWVGRSRRNGEDCALIEYRAFFNPVKLDAGMTMQARSDYWGEIWVSLATKQIEYATLREEVTGQITLPGQSEAQPFNVFRVGSFAPVTAGEP